MALFRAQVIGELSARELCRGELAATLRELSHQRFRPPPSANCICRSCLVAITASGHRCKLPHAEPYDPQSGGKMERFWRTLRRECLDRLPVDATLHDVQARMLAVIDRAYHIEPNASLMGQTPSSVDLNVRSCGKSARQSFSKRSRSMSCDA